ncbi:MAG: hypothetical protein COY80_04490 [Candidatus Pacebacteria bacterium CG_4_10_14_0_8_um_filter_42_14]|nr:MAG: hypothetical protein COY80_04490 [Candidatus Pacebacteria bacterium CG_4_10_14_0_8_um_filter_42_14]
MKQKLIALLGLTLLSILVFFCLRQWIFVVNQVSCSFEDGQSCEERIDHSVLKRTPLFFTNFYENESLQEVLSTQQLQLLDYKIVLPGTLSLVVDHEPVVYKLTLPDSAKFLVTRSGQLLPSSEDEGDNLVKINVSSSTVELISEDRVLPKVQTTFLELEKIISENNLNLEYVVWREDHELMVKLKSGQQLLIDPDSIATLSEIIPASLQTAARNSGDDKIEIDLRFALPVLRTPQ